MRKLLLFLLLSAPAFAQGVFYSLPGSYPNASVTVCPTPATTNPCAAPSSIFADQGLSSALSNPVTVASTGTLGFWAAAGQYTIQIGAPFNQVLTITLASPASAVGGIVTGSNGGTGGIICLNGSTSNAVSISTAASGGIIDFGSSCAQQSASANLGAKRLRLSGATTQVAGDYVLSAGWGTTASTAITNATSRDGSFVITVTSNGTGQAANPTVQLTFHDGSWTNVPSCIIKQTGGTGVFDAATPVTSRSATVYTWQWTGTPVAASTYEFTGLCTGT